MRSPLPVLALTTVCLGLVDCGGPVGDDVPLDRADPNVVTWVAPTTGESIHAGDVVILAVSTTNPAATAIDFAVDGASIGSCDATTCLESGVWSVATSLSAEGSHTLTASYGDAGRTISVTREITVLPMVSVTGAVTPGSSSEMDPTVGEPTTPAQSPGEPDLYGEVPTSPTSEPPDPGVEDLQPDEVGVPADPLTSDHPSAPRGFLDPSHDFDNNYRGRLWAVEGQRILLHRGRLLHDDNNVAECMATYGDAIARYADNRYISRAAVYALLWAETQCFVPDLEGDDNRAGPLNISASMCMALDHRSRNECLTLLHDQPTYGIDIAVRFLSSETSRRVHHNDPVRLAALFRTGSLRSTNANPWHLVSPPEYLTHFVEGYNAYRLWEAHANPAPTERAVFVGSTGRLQRGSDLFMPKGISLMGLALTPARDTDPGYQGWVRASLRLRDHRAEEFQQWHNWGANLLRMQVSQDGLDPNHPATYDATYRTRILDTVAAARAAHFVVIISMRNNMPGRDQLCMPDYPCDVTRRAWTELLAPRAGVASPLPTDRNVLLEVYNEPNGGNDVMNNGQYWEEWRPPHRQIVDAIRALGSQNVLIADGVRAGKFAPLSGFELNAPNVVYGLHPYPLHADIEYTRPSDFDSAFGDRCGHVACLATEWSTGSNDHCYDNANNPDHWSPHLSRAIQAYLRGHRIGTVMWPGDFEGALVYQDSGDTFPTTLTGWGGTSFQCDDATHTRHFGSGHETRYFFQHHRRLPGE